MQKIKDFIMNKIFHYEADDNTSASSYKEALSRQCYHFIFFVQFIFLFAWLPYIPIDIKIHPDEPLILALRLGLTFIGLISIILFYTKIISRKNGTLFLFILGLYLVSATAAITALSKGDEVYTAGFLFVLMCTIIVPLRYYFVWIYIVIGLSLFLALSFLRGMNLNDFHTLYSFNNLIASTLVAGLFIYLIDKIRYSSYIKSKELAKERNQLKQHNDILEKELDMAKHIQQNLMPSENPNKNISSIYKPMSQLGGDFFDFITFKDSNQIGIFVSDVSGHGVPAAFITSMIKSFLLKAGNYLHNPAELLNYLNELLFSKTAGHFITAFYGIYNMDDQEFIYSNAGHNLPYIIEQNKIDFLPSSNKSLPLAVLSKKELSELKKEYQNQSIQLKKNTRILLYTDGLVETVNINDSTVEFGNVSLISLINEYRLYTPKDFVEQVFKKLMEFRGSDELEDDVCMICLDI